ncbi:hypothetical protein DPMN_180965 [Dreissena polymorpha]|uniref:Uncharacterized protein n=1 Tax=Dreissena polymorpha TaxID=45954 RepID=A0A9D4DCY2_DREPO|nr:hypothetical protein DPMN_180965 [Dreissena polymorpha]
MNYPQHIKSLSHSSASETSSCILGKMFSISILTAKRQKYQILQFVAGFDLSTNLSSSFFFVSRLCQTITEIKPIINSVIRITPATRTALRTKIR